MKARGKPFRSGSLALNSSPPAPHAAGVRGTCRRGCARRLRHRWRHRSLRPCARSRLSDKMLAEIEQKNMSKESPILVRLFKEESELEVWKQDNTGRFELLKTYPICRWSGELGPKIKLGDRQAPEGFYTITPGQMNPNSNYYLAINTGFPNAYDRANGRTGEFLMIHGDCSSAGCYAMTDEQIAEIYALARESFFGGQKRVPDPGLSVPDDAAQHGQAPQFAAHGVLEDDQGRQRPLRGDAPRAQGRRVRQALCVRCRSRQRPGELAQVHPGRQVPDLRGAAGDRDRRCAKSSSRTRPRSPSSSAAARRRSRCAPAPTAA